MASRSYGYKVSINADKRYKLIRKLKVTTASEHDTLHLDDVLDGGNTSRDLYGDLCPSGTKVTSTRCAKRG